MNNTKRFDGKGELYDKARPKYAKGLFEHLKSELSIREGSIFADIGSGTGIFTEQLLGCGYKVYAVEPNADMRIKAEEKLAGDPNFISVDGEASATALPASSVDFITAAQAFHWFDADAFRKECERILKPNGKIIIVYNSRDESAECTKALAALRSKYNPEFHGFSNGISEEKCVVFFDGKCEIFRADNSPVYTKEGYIARALSSSYSLREGDEKFGEYLEELEAIFDKYSVGGYITVPTNTVAYIG